MLCYAVPCCAVLRLQLQIEENERSMKKQRMDAEEERKPRTVEEMAEEANTLKKLFEN